ncbi:MAG: hypothetical protein NTY17_08080 [Planctomycetia bacterium]|nr:hypothetical protein [Planctomycetia bacterium]
MRYPRRCSLVLVLILFVATLTNVGWSAEPPTAAAVTPSPRVRNEKPDVLLLVEARPDKLFNFSGEPVRAQVVLANRGTSARAATVKGWLEQGLDRKAHEQVRQVTVPAGGVETLAFTWPPEAITAFGQVFGANVEVDGAVVATGGDVFTSADNVWRVGWAGSHPVAFTAEHVKDLAGIERAVDAYRDRYVTTFEKFFWAHDDFAEMTPDQPEWFSGQARYHENLERLTHMCAHGLKVGVLPTTYGKSIGSGPAARDFIRAHPEMVYGYGGAMNFFPDTEDLARWDKDEKPYWQAVAWAQYNMNDPAVVQHGIDELIRSTKQFGWAAVRFDGHFQARTGKQRVGDSVVEFSRDDADRQTAANQRALKEQARKIYPRYAFGYNYANCMLDQLFQTSLRETIELCRDGGHIMDEYGKQNIGGSHPFRRWADFSLLLVREAEQVRRLGGELFPMTYGDSLVGRYQGIFALVASAHPNCGNPVVAHSRFATRHGELLWAKNLRNIWNPLGLVVAPPGVMWENFVREQRIDATHRRLIIHLVNPPAQETAVETARIEKEAADRTKQRAAIKAVADAAKTTPDYAAVDNLPPLQVAPLPQHDIPVRIVPEALDGRWKATRAVLLSSDAGTLGELPLDTSDPYFWQVIVPELAYWSVVVIEMEGI